METLESTETLEPKTLIDSETQTLATPKDPGLGLEEFPFKVGDFVWGKIKGNQWWPGRIRDPLESKDSNSDESSNLVAYFGVKSSSWCNLSQLKPFVSNFDKLANSSRSKSFKAALDLAASEFSKRLERQLSCNRVLKVERLDFGTISSSFSVLEFLHLVKDVALDVRVVNVLEIGMLKSWVVAFEKGLGVGHCRKAVSELVDKIDLDVVVTEDAIEENSSKKSNRGKKKKKNVASHNAHSNLDLKVEDGNVGDDVKEEEVGSGRRERKKSKYLSPPYTYLSGEFAKCLSAKVVKCSTLGLDKEEEEEITSALVQVGGFDIGELVSELTAMAVNHLHLKGNHLGKVVRGFFAEYRRSVFCMSGKVHGDNKTVNKEVDDKSEEGKKTEGKGGRKRKDVVNAEGETSTVKSEEAKNIEVKRARKKKVVVNVEGLTLSDKSEEGKKTEGGEKTPIGKSEEVKIDEGKGISLIDKSEEGAKIKMDGEAPIDKSEEGTKTEVEEKKVTGKSDEGKKTEVKRGRKRKVSFNGEGATPINQSTQSLEHSELKDEAVSKGNTLNEVANGKTPVTLNFQTVTVSYDGSSGRKRGKKKAEASQNTAMCLGCENVDNVEIGSSNGGTIIDVPVNVGCKITNDSGERKPRQRKNNKNKTNPEDPAALLLTFSPGITVPSKEELISACSKYGPIIESDTELLKESSSAKVVFARSSDAEKAFNDKVAALGPLVSSYRLRYLTGNSSSASSLTLIPVPKPPLPYIRKSLERMISSIGGVGLKPETSASLVGEMQGLLTKVDKLLTGPAADDHEDYLAIIPTGFVHSSKGEKKRLMRGELVPHFLRHWLMGRRGRNKNRKSNLVVKAKKLPNLRFLSLDDDDIDDGNYSYDDFEGEDEFWRSAEEL